MNFVEFLAPHLFGNNKLDKLLIFDGVTVGIFSTGPSGERLASTRLGPSKKNRPRVPITWISYELYAKLQSKIAGSNIDITSTNCGVRGVYLLYHNFGKLTISIVKQN